MREPETTSFIWWATQPPVTRLPDPHAAHMPTASTHPLPAPYTPSRPLQQVCLHDFFLWEVFTFFFSFVCTYVSALVFLGANLEQFGFLVVLSSVCVCVCRPVPSRLVSSRLISTPSRLSDTLTDVTHTIWDSHSETVKQKKSELLQIIVCTLMWFLS